MLENLILLAVYVIEAVKYCLGVYIVFHEKVERYSRYLVGIFALIFYGCFLRKEDNFDLILIYILVVCCSLWTFEGKIRERCVKVFLIFVLLTCIDQTIAVITKYFVETYINIFLERYLRAVCDSLWGLIILLIILIFSNKRHKKIKEKGFSYEVYFCVIFCRMTMALTVGGLNFAREYVKSRSFQMFTGILVFLSYIGVCLLCWLLVYIRRKNENIIYQLLIEKRLNESQMLYYTKLLEKEEETRRFRHDITNHLIYLTALAEEKEITRILEYLHTLTKQIVDIRETSFQTGNTLFDVILNDAIAKCNKRPRVRIVGRIVDNLGIDEVDQCTIFANLLTNAIEAINRNVEKRDLFIKFYTGKQNVKVSIANSVETKMNLDAKSLPKTSKENTKEHGMGLVNVLRAVEKNRGEFHVHCIDSMFIAEIILPINLKVYR